MKRTIYTMAFVAFLGVMANAQTTSKSVPVQQQPVPAETINPDGTISTQPAQGEPQLRVSEANQNPEGHKDGKRMAITEKGVPASKKQSQTESKKTEPAKSEN